MKRAVRRAHVDRLKQTRKHYWGYFGPHYPERFDELQKPGHRQMDEKQLGKVVQNPQNCSCLGCSGNYTRRYFGQRSINELGFIALAKSLGDL